MLSRMPERPVRSPRQQRTRARSWSRKRLKKTAVALIVVLGLGVAGAFAVPYLLVGDPGLRSYEAPDAGSLDPRAPAQDPTLKVMTLNLAHGAKDALFQLNSDTSEVAGNLDDIADVMRRERPDIVALQEADAPSFWSGNLDHARYLAEKSGFAQSVRSEHMKVSSWTFGTGLLSALPLRDPVAVNFRPAPGVGPRGFVVSAMEWPGRPAVEIDVVSVHLHFASPTMRKRQAREMVAVLSNRKRPLIVMGDFNCEHVWNEETFKILQEGLGLTAYQPRAADMDTFPLWKMRLDWILVSPELEFVSYEVLPDTLSDHRGVVSEIRMRDTN